MHQLDSYKNTRMISFNTRMKYLQIILHIHLRACNYTSSYHCPSPMTGSHIPKWEFILKNSSDFPSMNAPYL